MAELKTKLNDESVEDFLNKIDDEQRRADAFEIMKIMEEATGQPSKMWGGSIVGYGSYHYKYDSGHEGDMCKIGFSPRKQNFALYGLLGAEKKEEYLQKIGKHKVSGSCLHLGKLADTDKTVLKKLAKEAYKGMTKKYG